MSATMLSLNRALPAAPRSAVVTSRRAARAPTVQTRAADVSKVTGVVFEPFAEAQSELAIVEKMPPTESLARCNFHAECEAALNEQIKDNVGLPGFAQYFKNESDEERGHAELLMKYQNVRGGKVKLFPLLTPELEFSNEAKGDALYAMELALSLEKLNFQKLRALHEVASRHDDADMTNFIEEKLLQDQAETVKKVAEYVSQLRRIGKGHAVWHFDRELQ